MGNRACLQPSPSPRLSAGKLQCPVTIRKFRCERFDVFGKPAQVVARRNEKGGNLSDIVGRSPIDRRPAMITAKEGADQDELREVLDSRSRHDQMVFRRQADMHP